jgi:hypothetical protein
MTRKEAVRLNEQENTLLELGFTRAEAEQLRRISMTLHRWFEHECNGAIQRDGENSDGKPFWYSTETGRKYGAIPDREAGAMRRLRAIIDARNDRRLQDGTAIDVSNPPLLRYYIQGDPRGAVLYILRPGDVPEGKDVSGYYSRGICVY